MSRAGKCFACGGQADRRTLVQTGTDVRRRWRFICLELRCWKRLWALQSTPKTHNKRSRKASTDAA